MPTASAVVPDHSIITGMPADSSRRRRIWAWSLGHSPSSTSRRRRRRHRRRCDRCRCAGFVGHERDPAVDALCAPGAVLRPAGRTPDGRGSAIGPESTERPPVRLVVRCARRFYVETLGCPKNAVDSDKVVASLLADGLAPAAAAEDADLVVVNTCAFIEAARQESIDVALALADAKQARRASSCVTGCMAERYGDELAAALPEADAVVGFAGEGALADVVLEDASRRACAICWSCRGPRRQRAVGLREDRRRLRSRVCVLCHPVVPRHPAFAYARVDRGRSARARRARRVGARARRAGSRVVRARHRRAGRARRRCCAASTRSRASGLTRVRLLYLYPSEVKDPLVVDDARARRRSCRTSTCRCNTRRRACSGA